ncbi:MAG: hypothetical protein WC325_04385 [Candidatus Bathyarchaeia archaeon]
MVKEIQQLEAVLTEYKDCREEIKLRIQQRTQMTELYIVGLAAIAGFTVQNGNSLLMFVAPAYAIFIYEMIQGTYFYTSCLATYIREEIESKKIPYILGKVPLMQSEMEQTAKWTTRWLGWETNFNKCLIQKNKMPRNKVLHLFTWTIVFGSTASTVYGLIQQNTNILRVTFVGLLMLLVYGYAIHWIEKKSFDKSNQN